MSILIPIFIGLLVLATSFTVICIMRRKKSLVGGLGQKPPAAKKPAQAAITEGENKNFFLSTTIIATSIENNN